MDRGGRRGPGNLGAVPVRVDATPYSCVVVCLVRGCGARQVAGSMVAALTLARTHERTAHPGETDAHRRLTAQRSKDRARAARDGR